MKQAFRKAKSKASIYICGKFFGGHAFETLCARTWRSYFSHNNGDFAEWAAHGRVLFVDMLFDEQAHCKNAYARYLRRRAKGEWQL